MFMIVNNSDKAQTLYTNKGSKFILVPGGSINISPEEFEGVSLVEPKPEEKRGEQPVMGAGAQNSQAEPDAEGRGKPDGTFNG